MNIEEFRTYCIGLKGVTESFPFDESTLVFKVMGKMFALINVDNQEPGANLKCDTERAMELRERYEEIKPGYHMNKQHWNTVQLEGALTNEFIMELVDHSYELIVSRLTKKLKTELENI